jgi:hypothetical protein
MLLPLNLEVDRRLPDKPVHATAGLHRKRERIATVQELAGKAYRPVLAKGADIFKRFALVSAYDWHRLSPGRRRKAESSHENQFGPKHSNLHRFVCFSPLEAAALFSHWPAGHKCKEHPLALRLLHHWEVEPVDKLALPRLAALEGAPYTSGDG